MKPIPSLLKSTAKPLAADLTAAAALDGKVLDMDVPHQEQDCWCWCAVTVGTAAFFDPTFDRSQCKAANRVLKRTDACQSPTDPAVNTMFALDDALAEFGLLRAFIPKPITFDEVALEIRAGNPVGAMVFFLDSGLRHVLAIRGFRKSPIQMILVDDPLYEESEVPFDDFCRRYRGTGVWKMTYLTRSHGGVV